jgi:hypothetical protein
MGYTVTVEPRTILAAGCGCERHEIRLIDNSECLVRPGGICFNHSCSNPASCALVDGPGGPFAYCAACAVTHVTHTQGLSPFRPAPGSRRTLAEIHAAALLEAE